MMAAIKILSPKIFLGDIGSSTIQSHVESQGYSVVRDFCGHGIGKDFIKCQMFYILKKEQVQNLKLV